MSHVQKIENDCNVTTIMDATPFNVELLNQAGIKAEWSKDEGILTLKCPECGGKLLIHDERPWHCCFGKLECSVNGKDFAGVIKKLTKRKL